MIDGAKFRKLRRGKGLSQSDMARAMGVTSQVVYRAEAETKDLSLTMAASAAKILDCQIEDFLKPVRLPT